jgi:hypothetical protein
MADIKKANFMNVLSIFQKISVEGDGCTIEQVAACAAQLPSSKNITMQQISEITNELLLEGHIYSTIDENTFKAIIEQPEQPKDLMLRIEELVRENSALKKQRDELMQAHVEKNRWFIPLLKGFKKFKKVVAVAAAAAEDEEDEEDENEQEDEQEEGEEGEEGEEDEQEEKLSKKRERDE